MSELHPIFERAFRGIVSKPKREINQWPQYPAGVTTQVIDRAYGELCPCVHACIIADCSVVVFEHEKNEECDEVEARLMTEPPSAMCAKHCEVGEALSEMFRALSWAWYQRTHCGWCHEPFPDGFRSYYMVYGVAFIMACRKCRDRDEQAEERGE